RALDELLERGWPGDNDEAVPQAARRFEALGDRPRRLLPEATDTIDRPRPPTEDQVRGLDPTVLHLRTVGRNAEKDHDLPPPAGTRTAPSPPATRPMKPAASETWSSLGSITNGSDGAITARRDKAYRTAGAVPRFAGCATIDRGGASASAGR